MEAKNDFGRSDECNFILWPCGKLNCNRYAVIDFIQRHSTEPIQNHWMHCHRALLVPQRRSACAMNAVNSNWRM